MSEAAFSWPVRVYYEDTDVGGVVYYANYLRFLERARSEWLRSLGVGQADLAREHGALFVVRAVQMDLHAPARLDDELEICTGVAELRRASLVFSQTVERPADGETLCRATIRVACLDGERFKPRAIPEHILAEMRR